jgi:hypothetical protein
VIIYDFHCELEHRFEGWFSSHDDCERQVEAGQVHCPVCDSATVARLPSALHVKSPARDTRASVPVEQTNLGAPQAAATALASALRPEIAELRAAMDNLRHWVLSTEDVGPAFAEEARRIHNQNAPERAIRGVTTPAEARALVEEGIPVLPLPAHLVDKQH